MLKGPFKCEPTTSRDGGTEYRIADRDDNRIATCYDRFNALPVLNALNEGWHYKQTANLRKREMLADNTKE